MKRFSILLLAAILCLGCGILTMGGQLKAANETETLYVHNWQDYIGEGVVERFEQEQTAKRGHPVKVEYSTFGTNEIMYNNVKVGSKYDVICPSDYMIQKMMAEDLLQPFLDANEDMATVMPNYTTYASPYIKQIFNDITINKQAIAQYSVGYMWGTLGLVYNPKVVSSEDMKYWSGMWNVMYKNRITTKDSIRDTFFVGVAYAYRDELLAAYDKYLSGASTLAEYQAVMDALFNPSIDKIDEVVAKVEKVLSAQKEILFGFEVDNGKNDMIQGKIDINFAWSGDAVYAMDEAEANKVILNYSLPNEGSNVWFDGWVIPKTSTNRDLAREFADFMCLPEIAIANMDVICYSSIIAGDEMFENMFAKIASKPTHTGWYDISLTQDDEHPYAVDLTYYYQGTFDKAGAYNDYNGKPVIVYSAEKGRQFDAQYPDKGAIDRCTIMNYYTPEIEQKITDMWTRVKGSTMSTWLIVLIVVAGVAALGVGVYFIVVKTRGSHRKIVKKNVTK